MSEADMDYAGLDMGRWEPDARGRLERAALELFAERGFESATVADIAARAGLTERTFFRYFADKREVLFGGGPILEALMVEAVAGAPPEVQPLDAVAAGLTRAGEMMQERRAFARVRQTIIAANAELHERELIKMAKLASALTGALVDRGVPEATARLTAETGVAVFRVAFQRWVSDGDEGVRLAQLMSDALAELRAVTAA